jgi:AraC-like DNA-binding protein
MTSSQTFTFTDPDLYQRAVRTGQVEIVVAGKGSFHAGLTRIELSRLRVLRGHDNLPRVAWIKYCPSRSPIYFLARPNQASMEKSGMEVSPGDILVCSQGSSHHEHTTGPVHWGTLSLPAEGLAGAGRALVGRELTAPSITHLVRPAPQLMSRFLELHRSAEHLAKTSPILLAQPEVARALELTLVHAMIRCLAGDTPCERSVGNRRHVAITARLEDLLMANRDRPLYLAEICAEIGVAERTLRTCCEEHLGMGPIRYLWLRRMHLAHSTLNQATPTTATVTEIATAHGFWELGRFAIAYRKLFGESPSVTLSRSPVDPPTPQNHPFDLAAA